MCDVCCSDTMKKPIQCNICNFTACHKCVSKYLLEMSVNPKCMKCEKPWSRKQLVNALGQYFVSHTYKKKRENVLFDIERAMLPDTQPLAARERRITELNGQIYNLEARVSVLDMTISRLSPGILDSEFEEFLENRKILRMERHSLKEEIINIQYRKNRLMERPMRHEKRMNSNLTIKCLKETCKGYVDVRKGVCELCETRACKNCFTLYHGEDQECKKDDLETAKLIRSETKNCPSCKTLISKINGCDQMFCTRCHTAFSWRTGEVCVGRIHNPHYYEFLRQSGREMREIGDIPCGGLPYANKFIIENRYLRMIHQIVSHVENFEIHRLTNEINNVNGNLDLRIGYLNDRIPELMFKQEIYKREKALEKKREILTILNTFVVVCADIFRGSVIPESKECRVEFENIRNFTNETMYDVSRVYKCVVPIIRSDWIIRTERHEVQKL